MFGIRHVGRCSAASAASPSIRQIQPRSLARFSTGSSDEPPKPADPLESRSAGRGQRIQSLKKESSTMKLFTESVVALKPPRPVAPEADKERSQILARRELENRAGTNQRNILFKELQKITAQPDEEAKADPGRKREFGGAGATPQPIELKSLIDKPSFSGGPIPREVSSKSFFQMKNKSLQPKPAPAKKRPDRLLGEDQAPPRSSPRVPFGTSSTGTATGNRVGAPRPFTPRPFGQNNNTGSSNNRFAQKPGQKPSFASRRNSSQSSDERRRSSSGYEYRDSKPAGTDSLFFTGEPENQEEVTLEKYLSRDSVHPFTLADYYSKRERLGYELFRLPDDDKYEPPTVDEIAYYGYGRTFPVGETAYDGIDWDNFDRIARVSNEKYYVNITPLRERIPTKFKTPEEFIASIPKNHEHYKSIMDVYKIVDRSPWYNDTQKLNMLTEVSEAGLHPS